MRWLPILLIFLLAYIEISLFINIADVLGVAFTLLLVIFTSCVGISLMRNQGMRTFVQIQQKLSAGDRWLLADDPGLFYRFSRPAIAAATSVRLPFWRFGARW